MKTQIFLTTENLIKNPNTKTTYLSEKKETEELTEEQYNNIVSNDMCKFFKRLGGGQSKVMSYTCNGYKCTKLVSTSPDRQFKTIRMFKFTCE